MSDLSTTMANKAAAQQAPTMRQYVERQAPAIEKQLAGVLNSESFVRAALNEIQKSPQLQHATVESVLGSIMLAAQLKLEVGSGLGHFYLTPRMDHGTQICLPIIGYQGLIELAYRSGRVGKIETFVVREGDFFEYGANSERGRFFDWKPKDFDQQRPWTDVVVAAQILGGGLVWETMPKDKILERRPTTWQSGPWKTNEVEMARKTLVRELSPYLPKSTELGVAVQISRQVEEQGQVVTSLTGVPDLIVSEKTGEVTGGDPA